MQYAYVVCVFSGMGYFWILAGVMSTHENLTKKMKILLVENDVVIGSVIQASLNRERYIVDWIKTFSDAQMAILNHAYIAILLNVTLPDTPGQLLLKKMRQASSVVPVIMMTACNEVAVRIENLNAGADDCLVQPFDVGELMARLKSVIRRSENYLETVVTVGSVAINVAQQRVQREGMHVPLTPREFSLLRLLVRRKGRILSRAQIEEQMYGWGMEVESNTVEVHIHHLRKKLGYGVIRTIRGVGYMLPCSHAPT